MQQEKKQYNIFTTLNQDIPIIPYYNLGVVCDFRSSVKYHSKITALQNGKFAIAFQKSLNNQTSIYEQVFYQNCTQFNNEYKVVDVPSGNDFSLISLNNGNFFVANVVSDGSYVSGQMFNFNGAKITDYFSLSNRHSKINHLVTDSSNGGYFAIAYSHSDGNYITARIVNKYITYSNNEFDVAKDVKYSSQNTITELSDTEWLITWNSENNGIFGRMVNYDGNFLNNQLLISDDTNIYNYAVEGLYNGNFVLVWNLNSAAKIYGQFFHNNCIKNGEKFLINDSTDISHSKPIVMRLKQDQFIIIWDQQESYNSKVCFKVLNNVGIVVGTTHEIIYQGVNCMSISASILDDSKLIIGCNYDNYQDASLSGVDVKVLDLIAVENNIIYTTFIE